MKEGWQDDNYWALCDDLHEAERLSALYEIDRFLPGYHVVGLRGWDDFILCDNKSRYFTVPTVPLDPKYLEPFQFPTTPMRLESDERHTGKIKWYVQPIVFGGDPRIGPNVIWVDYSQHQRLVRFWNDKYREVSEKR